MMADFVSSFWNIYVIGLVAFSLLFCAFIFGGNMQKQKGPAQLKSHVWDETLEEYDNPLPRWWLYLAWVTLIFSVAYLVLFPGFGNMQGVLGWTSVNQYEAEVKAADNKYGPLFEQYQKTDLAALAADPQARAAGERLFLTYCSQCHGSDAHGSKGFPNLTDNHWIWGGEPETIEQTILGGRNYAVMAPWGEALGAEKVRDVANYVRQISGQSVPEPQRLASGQEVFMTICVTCHGAEGKGDRNIGSADLTSNIWLYGGSLDTIIETVTDGRNGVMPAFEGFLGKAKVHLLAAYVYGFQLPQNRQQ